MADDARGEAQADRVLTTGELRQSKPGRAAFRARPRNPVTVVLDGVRQNYNLGAIFRLCDAFLVERLVICGAPVVLRKRKLVQAAAGTQGWVPWEQAADAGAVVRSLRATGHSVTAVELTPRSVSPAAWRPRLPLALVLGGERAGVSPDALAVAEQTVAIPMLGMANSLNVAAAAAIMLHELRRRQDPPDDAPASIPRA